MKRFRNLACCVTTLLCLLFSAQVPARPQATTEPEAKPAADGFVAGDEAPKTTPTTAGTISLEKVDLGHAADNPYKAMIEDLVGGPKSDDRDPQAPRRPDTTPPPEQRSMFYDEDELKARATSVKSAVTSMFGDDEPKVQSEEERELSLQRDIAMRGAYRGARLAGGVGVGDAGDGEARRAGEAQDNKAKMRMMELGFMLWDVLTHPLTIALLVLYGFTRMVIAMVRVAKDPYGRNKREHGDRGHARRASDAPASRAPTPLELETEQERRYRERRRHSRRRRSRRSFLDYFRSV